MILSQAATAPGANAGPADSSGSPSSRTRSSFAANIVTRFLDGWKPSHLGVLRKAKGETVARRYTADGSFEEVASGLLRAGDVIYVEAGHYIPGDGEVIEGVASVDESAITGESAPVIRESGGDRSAVTGGTKVLSDWIKVRITANPGETFLDRMIALVEGAKRQKTPNEIALTSCSSGLTIIFLLAVVTLLPFAMYSKAPQTIFVLVALLVCLIPTTIGGLLSAIGIAGMDRLVAVQRHGHERPGRRGRRRRGRAAARQDRHHHPGQPPGHGVHARAGRERRSDWPTPRSSPRWPTRRPKAARSWCWPRRSTTCAAATWTACTPSSSPSPPRRA